MIGSLLKKMISTPKKHNNPIHFDNYLMDGYGLYIEDYFAEILKYEKKRSERSQKPFLFMLLSLENILHVNGTNEVINKIASALFTSTREIDVKGWYKYDSAIGVIFIELNGTDRISLERKIYNKLCDTLGNEQVKKIKISFYLFPEDYDKGKGDDPADSTLFLDSSKRKGSKKGAYLFKRIIDITGSIAGLIIFSPLFIIILLCIKLTSKGAVFFRQERVGDSGKRFIFLKFRSMYVNNDHNIHREYIKKLILDQKSYDDGNGKRSQIVYKINDDPRITPFGKFLRKTSLDELPQFINVLKGEMSLVGPRPPIPYELEDYDLWHRRRVMEVRPGITGLWQVKGRSSTTFNDMVRLDLKYIREWSFWLDMKILILTPIVVITGKGAY